MILSLYCVGVSSVLGVPIPSVVPPSILFVFLAFASCWFASYFLFASSSLWLAFSISLISCSLGTVGSMFSPDCASACDFALGSLCGSGVFVG